MESSGTIPKGDLKNKLGIEYTKLDPNVDYLKSKGFIDVNSGMGGYYAAKITAKGMDKIENNEDDKQSIITQNFYGNVENLALGDINKYNTLIYLNALINAIQDSDGIPETEKKNLIDKIKNIVENPYVAGITSEIMIEAIKLAMTNLPF